MFELIIVVFITTQFSAPTCICVKTRTYK